MTTLMHHLSTIAREQRLTVFASTKLALEIPLTVASGRQYRCFRQTFQPGFCFCNNDTQACSWTIVYLFDRYYYLVVRRPGGIWEGGGRISSDYGSPQGTACGKKDLSIPCMTLTVELGVQNLVSISYQGWCPDCSQVKRER